MRLWLTLATALLLPVAAAAGPVLEGQPAELRALVIQTEGAAPQLSTRGIAMIGGPGVEIPSMHAVRAAWGDDISQIVEVSVDLETDSILISFAGARVTRYADAYFAGYEFRFPDLPQAVIASAVLDRNERLYDMEDSRLGIIEGGLRVNVEGLYVDPQARIRIRFGVNPVPSS